MTHTAGGLTKKSTEASRIIEARPIQAVSADSNFVLTTQRLEAFAILLLLATSRSVYYWAVYFAKLR